MIPLIPCFFWHPITTQVLSGSAFSQLLFSKHAEFLWVGNAPESSSTLTSMWGALCVCVVYRHTSMCCVYVHTSHACVLHVSCVVCMLSSLCVPMSHAYDWMHTSMSLCVHIYVGMCLCVCMYICMCYTPWFTPFASWAHLGHALSMIARVWVWSSQHFVLPLSGLITLSFKCCSHMCVTQTMGPLLSLDLGPGTLCGTRLYYLMHHSAVLSCHDACPWR